jgi:hypothetical protein
MKYWQIEHSVVQSKFWTRHEVLTCLVQSFCIESSCMFSLSVLHVWFKTFGWNRPVYSTCLFFMSGSKLCWTRHEVDKLNIQGDSIQKFWTRYEVLTSWTYRVILSKCCVPDIKYWQVEHTESVLHVWFKTFGWNRPVYSTCLFFMSGSKLGWNHRVCSTCLKVFNQTLSTAKVNIQGDSSQKFWTSRHEVLTNWTYRMVQSRSF